MAKENNAMAIILVIAIVGIGFFYLSQQSNAVNGGGELIRILPSEVDSGTFQVKYSTNLEGKWGIIIEDTISGDCTFSNGEKQYKAVMLSTEGNTRIVEVTINGDCTFSGNYNIVSTEVGQIINLPTQTVKVK